MKKEKKKKKKQQINNLQLSQYNLQTWAGPGLFAHARTG